MDTDYAKRLADTVMRRFPRAGRYPYKDWSYPQGYLLMGFAKLWEAANAITRWRWLPLATTHDYG